MGLQLIIKEVLLNDIAKKDLPYEAKKIDLSISRCREKLMMMVASTPMDFGEDGDITDAIDYAHEKATAILAELEELIVRRHLVMCALEDLEMVEESY